MASGFRSAGIALRRRTPIQVSIFSSIFGSLSPHCRVGYMEVPRRQRPPRFVADRREQARRSEARRLQGSIRAIACLDAHRGCAASHVGRALAGFFQERLAAHTPSARATPEPSEVPLPRFVGRGYASAALPLRSIGIGSTSVVVRAVATDTVAPRHADAATATASPRRSDVATETFAPSVRSVASATDTAATATKARPASRTPPLVARGAASAIGVRPVSPKAAFALTCGFMGLWVDSTGDRMRVAEKVVSYEDASHVEQSAVICIAYRTDDGEVMAERVTLSGKKLAWWSSQDVEGIQSFRAPLELWRRPEPS